MSAQTLNELRCLTHLANGKTLTYAIPSPPMQMKSTSNQTQVATPLIEGPQDENKGQDSAGDTISTAFSGYCSN